MPIDRGRYQEWIESGGILRFGERFFRLPEPGHRLTGWVYPNPHDAKLPAPNGTLKVDPRRLWTPVQAFELDDTRDLLAALRWFFDKGYLEKGGSVAGEVEGTVENFVFRTTASIGFFGVAPPTDGAKATPGLFAGTEELGGIAMTIPAINSPADVVGMIPGLDDLLRELPSILDPGGNRDPDSPAGRMEALLRDLRPSFDEELSKTPVLRPQPAKQEDEEPVDGP